MQSLTRRQFISHKDRVNARKLAADRESFNDWVWEKVIVQSHKMFRNRKGWWFHHKIRTDGVAVSILFSREAAFKADKSINLSGGCTESEEDESAAAEEPRSRTIGIDPGRKNLITATDSNGVTLRYTCKQRTFESKIIRHRKRIRQQKYPMQRHLFPDSVITQ